MEVVNEEDGKKNAGGVIDSPKGTHGSIGQMGHKIPTYEESLLVADNERLKHENMELQQMIMVQRKSSDIKMRCVEAAITKSTAHHTVDDVLEQAEKIFLYVTSQQV